MDEGLYKPINLKDFLKNSDLLNPPKEHLPYFMKQVFEKTFEYWEKGEIDKAKEHIAFFNSPFTSFQIGHLVEMAIDYNNIDAEKVIEQLNAIPESQRNNPLIGCYYHFVKAVLYFSLWDIDQAKEACDYAIKFDKKERLTYYLRGVCYSLRALHHKAIADYKKALKGPHYKNEITANLAYSYLTTKKYRKALKLHKLIVDKFADNHKVQYNTGISYKRFRKYDKAIIYFDRAIALNPDNPGYKLTRGRTLILLNKHEQAQPDLQFASDSGNDLAGELLKINSAVIEQKISSKTANKMVLNLARKKSS